jgi:hypothetical protein
MGFGGGHKEEKGNGGWFDSAGGWGRGWRTCKDVVLFCGWSLIAYTGINYNNNTCVGITNFMILRPKLN